MELTVPQHIGEAIMPPVEEGGKIFLEGFGTGILLVKSEEREAYWESAKRNIAVVRRITETIHNGGQVFIRIGDEDLVTACLLRELFRRNGVKNVYIIPNMDTDSEKS